MLVIKTYVKVFNIFYLIIIRIIYIDILCVRKIIFCIKHWAFVIRI